MKRNWENALEIVEGRVRKEMDFPKLLYKGRVLVLNNLVSSCCGTGSHVSTPHLIYYPRCRLFWSMHFLDKRHWLPQSLLYLQKEEVDILHLASRRATLRLEFISYRDVVWNPLACSI